MDCSACHQLQGQFRLDPSSCQPCHRSADPGFVSEHVSNFGENCLACHDGRDRLAHFDHKQTDFPLDGVHSELRCADCHQPSPQVRQAVGVKARNLAWSAFQETSMSCVSCHEEPEAHLGLFGTDCETCHTTSGWLPGTWKGEMFNHWTASDFSLAAHTQTETGAQILCRDCHSRGKLNPDAPGYDLQQCLDCHAAGEENAAFMQEHQARFGPACLDCHDGVDRMSNFDHARFFPLEGAHIDQPCEGCHVNQVFRGTPGECVQCHAEPEIHAGFFGLQCQYCHTSDAWRPAHLQMHIFPLGHGDRGEIACETCHSGAYTVYTCYGCHDHQPDEMHQVHLAAGVPIGRLQECAQCHPTGLKREQGG